MSIQRKVVETFTTSDGKEFYTMEAAEAHESTLGQIKVYREFAVQHQDGKSDKAVQMVVNILVAYHEWLSAGGDQIIAVDQAA